MTRRRSAGILGVFQALTTKSEPKKTSQIVQIIFEQCLKMTVDGADVTDRITSPDGVLTEQDIVCEKGGEENHAE